MLEIIKQHNMPLDRIVHVEIMATDTIPADLPPMVEFKDKADRVIKERYGIEVERLRAPNSFETYFYKRKSERSKKWAGTIYGWPLILNGIWCNSRLKMSVLNKFNKKNITQYVGIAVDEPRRFKILGGNQRSPLVEHGVTEDEARKICEEIGLLSPIYKQSARGGCWFCPNQSISQLRMLRKQYPEYWDLMLKWDKDSPITFKPDGKTVHHFEERFRQEDMQLSFEFQMIAGGETE